MWSKLIVGCGLPLFFFLAGWNLWEAIVEVLLREIIQGLNFLNLLCVCWELLPSLEVLFVNLITIADNLNLSVRGEKKCKHHALSRRLVA